MPSGGTSVGISSVDRVGVSEFVCCGRDSVRELTFLLIFSLLCVVPVAGQSPNATINGIVLDPSGAAITGAQVVVVNDATGVQYTTKTNGEGIYVVPNLPPGLYRVQVSNSGFKTIIKPDIVIHVQDALAINFTLPIGAASEIVTVQGGTPLINTENAAVSTVIDRQFVGNLPLNGRSFNTLLQLTPGVVIAPTSGVAPGQFSIAGQRTDANNFTVDGVSANFGVAATTLTGQSGLGTAQAFSATGGTSSLVSVDALQEFRIVTSSFAPEFGRSPGGQVILTTRSGTNGFHGGAYEYFRNEVLDANDWFANAAGQPRAAERHNDFGGSLGGPLLKDRTFFFVSYEGARLRLPQSEVVPTPSEYARTTAPSSLAPFLNVYPQPDNRTVVPGIYTAPFTGVWSNSATLNAGSVRIDHTFNYRFSVFGRYNEAPSQLAARVGALSTKQFTAVNTRTLTAGLNMFVSSRLSNTLRGNYSTQNSDATVAFASIGGAVSLDPTLLGGSLPCSETHVFFQTFDTGYFQCGRQARNGTKQLNLVDDLTVTLGVHQLRFGTDYRAIFLNTDPPFHNSSFNVSNVQSFLSNGGMGRLNAQIFLPSELLAGSLSLYGQDTWKPGPRLALTFGFRWELSPAPSARGKTRLAAWEGVNDPATFALAPPGTPVWGTTYGNFAPRFGMAYSLTQNGGLVLRAGGGIFYDIGVGQAGTLAFAFPNSFSKSSSGVTVPITGLTPYLPSTSVAAPFPGAYGFSPSLELPRSYQWNLALEKSLGARQVVSATYVGQAGRDLLRAAGYWQPNANFNSFFYLTTNQALSNYHALQLQYRRPLSARVQALLNYTWSHSLDNGSDDVPSGSNTVISAANDYASSAFDAQHSFSGALSVDLPGLGKRGFLSLATRDWSLDTVVVTRSGFPFNAQYFVLSSLLGFAQVRPDRVPGQPPYLFGSECAAALGVPGCPGGKGLNPAAFTGTVGDGRTPAGTIPVDASGNPLRQGTEARNDIRGFGLTQIDLSVRRKFALTERVALQLRADAFNLFNHPNFANPDPSLYDGPPFFGVSSQMLNQALGGLNPLFQEGGPRSLQLSLRLNF